MLIDDAVTRSGQNYIRGGTEKGKKCGFGKKRNKTVHCLSIYFVACLSVFVFLAFYRSELFFTLFLDNGIPP